VGNWFRNGIAPALAKTNRVIGIDMRGHALSDAGPPNGRQYMARDVLEFMQQQKIEKAHIGGYSMGGGVTLSLLATNPEKFITASFQGSGIGETAEWRDKIPKDKDGTDPEADKARQLYEAARAARGESAGAEAVGNNRADIARLQQNATPADTEAAQARMRQRQTMMDSLDLTKIKFPVMAINGEFDRPISKTHRMWRELDNFTNLVLPGKGHLSAVMEGLIPQQYVDGYRDFIVGSLAERRCGRSTVAQLQHQVGCRQRQGNGVGDDDGPGARSQPIEQPERDADGEDHIHPQRDTLSIAAADGLERLGSEGAGGQHRCGIAEQIEVHVRCVSAGPCGCPFQSIVWRDSAR
jgi:pimeloyl-ACP methyl ester carboxylesterase